MPVRGRIHWNNSLPLIILKPYLITLTIGGVQMISNVDYMKLTMSRESEESEIDPVLRSRAWSAVFIGLAMFWCIVALAICNIWIIT